MVDMASRWNVEGLIIIGYNEEQYHQLSRKLNKKMVLIDAYPKGGYSFQNVGVDDYSGGYQIGEVSAFLWIPPGDFLFAETEQDSDYARWLGLQTGYRKKMAASAAAPAMWSVPTEPRRRLEKYEELLPLFSGDKGTGYFLRITQLWRPSIFLQTRESGFRIRFPLPALMIIFMRRSSGQKLTTIHQDPQALGRKAAEKALSLIDSATFGIDLGEPFETARTFPGHPQYHGGARR